MKGNVDVLHVLAVPSASQLSIPYSTFLLALGFTQPSPIKGMLFEMHASHIAILKLDSCFLIFPQCLILTICFSIILTITDQLMFLSFFFPTDVFLSPLLETNA